MSAYLVAICKITNVTEDFKLYAARAAEILHRHGGRYIVRGPAKRVVKGDLLEGQVVIISEFPSMDALEAFVNDEEYVNEVAPLRDGTGEYHFAAYESTAPESA